MGRTEIQVIMRSAKKGYFAHGAFDGKGLTVYAGSQVSDSIHSSIKGNLSVMRSMHLDEDGRTLEDMYFKSPSAASSFVCGRSSNGWVEWVTPEGVKLSAYRDIDAGSVEAPSGATVPASSTDDEQKNGRTHKVSTETILQDLIAYDSNVRIDSKDRHTALYYRDSIVASIYYRANAIRIEMRDTPAVHTLYEELLAESLVCQKPSANPYATPGKYAFFVNTEDEETVLLAILIAVQDGRLSANQASVAKKQEPEEIVTIEADSIHSYEDLISAVQSASNAEPAAESAREELESTKKTEAQVLPPHESPAVTSSQSHVRRPEDSGRLEKKLDSLIEVIANMYSSKGSTPSDEVSAPEETDKRFRLESIQGNAPMLMLRKPTAITGLIFAVKLYAIGLEGSSEQSRVFVANGQGEQLSEAQLVDAMAGEEYNCRFELKSSASEEKAVYLVVQSVNAAANEARQLIECPVKIAFAADFGL